MDEYRILQILLDNQQVYIRREKVGSSTIGGDSSNPYQQAVVQAHFHKMLKYNNTKVDRAVSSANLVNVTVLHTMVGTSKQADALKATEVRKAKAAGVHVVLNAR